VRVPFYRREEGVRRSWAVAPANQSARAGVIAWDRDDVRGVASAGRGNEGARGFPRRRAEGTRRRARRASARAREGFPGRACPWIDGLPVCGLVHVFGLVRRGRENPGRGQERWGAGQIDAGLSGGA
jgi:hypothetical protein